MVSKLVELLDVHLRNHAAGTAEPVESDHGVAGRRKPANHLSDVDALVNQDTLSVIKRFNQTAVASDVQ